jgi:hypothetical protein
MTPRIEDQLNELEVKIEAIKTSVEKTERYLKWTFWITFIFVVGPLVLMMLAIPSLIRGISAITGSVSL